MNEVQEILNRYCFQIYERQKTNQHEPYNGLSNRNMSFWDEKLNKVRNKELINGIYYTPLNKITFGKGPHQYSGSKIEEL